MKMATRNDTNEQTKAADEAARTARTVTNETAQNTVESGLNTTTQTLQHMADQFTQVLGFNGPQAQEAVRRSSENLQAVTQAGTVLARGAQAVTQEVFGHIQDRLTKNVDAVNRLVGPRPGQDFVAGLRGPGGGGPPPGGDP